ncbi:hypothetical protein CLOP_g14803 [Closterium sp. NIES-67]|nr:hypothetical protein CLOP_g14803 [Closterium sp. NIES-67]
MPFKAASTDGPVCCLCGGNRHGEPPPDVVRRITYHDRSSRPREASSAAGAFRLAISGKARNGGDRRRAEGRSEQEDGGGSGKGAARGAGAEHAAEGESREMRWPPMRPDPHFADPCARYDDCFFDHNDFLISCPLHTRSLMLRRHGSHLPEFNAFFGQPAGRLSGQMVGLLAAAREAAQRDEEEEARAAADLEIVPGGEGEQSGVTAGGDSWDARARATGAAAEGAAATAAAAGSAGRVRDAVESGTQTASPDALDPANATETAKAPLSTPAAPAPAEAKAAAAPAEAVAEAAEAAAAAAAAEGAPAEAVAAAAEAAPAASLAPSTQPPSTPPPVPPTSAFPPWSAIGGLRPVILSLTELVLLPLRYPALFPSLGIAPPRGVLLHGLPGTGKTLVVRALAGACARGEREVAFFARHGADCLGKYVGDAEKHLRLLFEVAKQRQPSIIFFDELDGLAPARGPNQDPTHSSVVATLLALLDGLDSRGAVTVIAATNRIDAIDPALRRPGRFDREIFFPLPGVKDRKAILKAITRGWGAGVAPSGKVLEELAGRSEGFAGADLRAVCNDALMAALRKKFPMETALALDALPGAEAFGSGQPQMPAAGTPSCPRGTNSLVQAKMYRLPIPEIQVDAQDWLAALQRAQVPCALRTAAASFGKLGLATVPRYLLPILAPALVRLVRSLAETAGVGDVMRDGMNDRIGDEEEDSEEGSEEEGEEEGEEEDEMRESEEGTSEEGEEEEGEEQEVACAIQQSVLSLTSALHGNDAVLMSAELGQWAHTNG